MGNNAAYTAWEKLVVSSYDEGTLDQDRLSEIMEAYRGTDIDHGGSYDLRTKDGLSADDVVLKVFGATVPARPDVPDDYKSWTEQEREAMDRYWDAHFDALFAITGGRFGWC